MTIEDSLVMLSAEIKTLRAQANLITTIRGMALNEKGRLTEFGKKFITICLEHQMPQKYVANILGISNSAVNQHAEKKGNRIMDNTMKKYDVIKWDYNEIDVTIDFIIPRDIYNKDIQQYSGKVKFGQYENNKYILITSSREHAHICSIIMGNICDSRLRAGIITKVKINGVENVLDGFVESVNFSFMSTSLPIVLIQLGKLIF